MRNLSDTLIKKAIELTLIPGIGLRTRNRIHQTVEDITELFVIERNSLKLLGIADQACRAIQSRSCRAAAEEIFDWARRHDCRFLVRGVKAMQEGGHSGGTSQGGRGHPRSAGLLQTFGRRPLSP